MRRDELLRILRRRAKRLGLTHQEVEVKGSHLKLRHGSGQTVIPMHRVNLPRSAHPVASSSSSV